MQPSLRCPTTSDEFADYYQLRWRMLRESLGLPLGSEKDDREAEATHIAAFLNDKIVGVGRLHQNSSSEGQIRYMATDPLVHGRGIGSLILRALEVEGSKQSLQRITLDARDTAVDFYLKNGYRIFDSFVHVVGLPCKKMEKLL